MEFHVSLIGRKNLTGEIYRQLRRAIVDGLLGPGDLLPPTRELARFLSVSRSTVTVAYDRLVSEGYATARVGAGTVVSFQGESASARRQRRRAAGVLQPRPVWESIRMPASFDKPAPFNFRTGIPDTSLFPQQAWRRLITRELRAVGRGRGAYGDAAGHRGLREAIARHIAVSRGVEASADDVTVTSGAQQAIDVLAKVMLAPGDPVAVEDPGYLPPTRLLRALGARVIGVPVDSEGLVVDALPRHARLVYVTPSHQYPLGVTMSMPRRRALLSWAERTNTAVIEDDYDSEFRFGGRPVEPLHTLDTAGRVIYIGSFSKTMLPSLRLGFVVTPPSLRSAMHKAKHVTDWHTNLLVQAALARFIDDGEFARHVRKVGGNYRARHEMIMKTLKRDFAGCVEAIPTAVGLHVAAQAGSMSVEETDAVVRRALDKGVDLHRLAQFAIDAPAQAGLVLGYGGISVDDIEEGLRRLRSCFDA